MKIDTLKSKRNRRRDTWPDSKLAILRREWAKGSSARTIAKQSKGLFGQVFTRNAICGAVARYIVPAGGVVRTPKPVPPPKVARQVPKPLLRIVPKPTVEPLPIGPWNDMPDKGCKFIHGDPWHTRWRACGHAPEEDSPYCEHHTKVCFNAAPRRPPAPGSIVPLRRLR